MPQTNGPTPALISPAKRRLFLAITMALPLVGLLLVEVILRIFGWGGYPAWIREAGKLPSGESVCFVEPAAAEPYFFANPARIGYPDQTDLLMPKPPGTVRIFLVGESAAKGFPQPRNLAMSSFLQAMLADACPGRKIEVINLGTVAVASFPLVYQVRDALRFSPDLFIFYAGNNEFFGAYGTVSINAAGSLPPWALRLLRAARGLALVQVLDSILIREADGNRTLMESMIGRTFIPADSPLRAAAARNLSANLGTMLDAVQAAGVPAVVCTTASNESGMAPLGQDDLHGLDERQTVELARLSAEAAEAQDPALAADLLRQAARLAPRHARVRFLLGQALARTGRIAEARRAFLQARDYDTMPWRPISLTEDAIRAVARVKGAATCDVAEIFRSRSLEGATGWELLDDHVHLSIAGQAAAARAIAASVAPLLGSSAATGSRIWRSFDAGAIEALPAGEVYADRLGRNLYDDYGVFWQMSVLFDVSFMRAANPQAAERFASAVRSAEGKMPLSVLSAAREWRTGRPVAGSRRPLTATAARILAERGRTAEAVELYEIAARQVPAYTAWQLEYIYHALAGRFRLAGRLDEVDKIRAATAIAQGEFLLSQPVAASAADGSRAGVIFTVAGLHELCGTAAEVIPILLEVRPSMSGGDLAAADQALVLAYLMTGRKGEAVALVEAGIARGGRFAHHYRRLGARAAE
jgi:tetratricopeptide (TPR) repeat protein